MTITVKKQREYLGVLSEAAQDVRSRLDKIDRDYEDIREMRQHNEEAYMRLLRRQERIRQKDIEIAQLKAEIEYGMRLYAENEVKLEVKKARAAYLEARIAENGRRKALGLPLLPRDPTRHRT
ncbi:hypothetical protein BC834DRAFT_164003 [Gloeopeniophorella convolvens]|nr:hypothetical protein BC834DRAFT_164003 [Gloeopeniophorella convolvens]